MQSAIRIFLIVFLGLFAGQLAAAEWDLEYWQYFNWENWRRGRCSLTTLGEVRFKNNISTMSYYRLAENFAFDANRYIDLELHYSFLHYIPTGSSSFQNTNRIEFELNTTIPLGKGFELLGRNRVELIKVQGNSKWQTVLRHRSRLIIPITGLCYVVSYNISDEVFYDTNQCKFTQNRFIPAELTFEFTPTVSLNVFVMIRNSYSFKCQKWFNAAVFGSNLSF